MTSEYDEAVANDYEDDVADNYEEAVERPVRQLPHKPKGVREPQDRLPKKKTAAQREAERDETVTIEFHGMEFELLADQDEWPIVAVQAFANGKNIDGIEQLMGPVQWAKFVSRFPKRRHFSEFADIFSVEFGFKSPGE